MSEYKPPYPIGIYLPVSGGAEPSVALGGQVSAGTNLSRDNVLVVGKGTGFVVSISLSL